MSTPGVQNDTIRRAAVVQVLRRPRVRGVFFASNERDHVEELSKTKATAGGNQLMEFV